MHTLYKVYSNNRIIVVYRLKEIKVQCKYLHLLCFTIIHCTVLHLCVCFVLYFTCMELRLVSFLLNEYVMLCYVKE